MRTFVIVEFDTLTSPLNDADGHECDNKLLEHNQTALAHSA
jgi:hypothetical protein